MFVLDGNWFNQHYKSKSVDYWTSKNPETKEIESLRGPDKNQFRKAHEAEDRVYSKTPSIPVDGVTAIHILIKPGNDNPFFGLWAKTVLKNAKQRDIPAYLYNDESAWRKLDTRLAVPQKKNPTLRVPRGTKEPEPRLSTHKPKGYLYPWIELIAATDKAQLSKDADGIRYNLQYTYYAQDALRDLVNEMSNARRPDSGIDRENAVKIIEFMKKNHVNDLKGLVELLTTKWKNIAEKENRVNTQS
jgi:hypothetical protein